MATSRKKKLTETVDAEDQPQSETAGASAGGGRSGQRSKSRRGEEPPGKLNGSIWEDGRGFSPGQEWEFAEVAKKMDKAALQSLANQKCVNADGEECYLIEGFGVEPDEDAEELNEVTGAGSPGRRAGSRKAAEEDEDEEDEE